jgi:hypothetical protein
VIRGKDKEKIGRRLGKGFKLPATKLRFINQIQRQKYDL